MTRPTRLVGRRPRMTRLAAPPPGSLATPRGFVGVRFTADLAEQALKRFAQSSSRHSHPWSGRRLNILALSGGGAGGAFGAGVLVGLSQAGARPQFDIVTGVSTGALIAPMAFLGPQWDARLMEGYTGGHAADLLGLRSVVVGDGLDVLVGRFIDDALLQAIAAEHARGRRLFVATTNLDRQQNVVWDLGAVAAHGGREALALFRDVLVASASLPGLFPPKLIDVETATGAFQEMHVDGGASTPLFILPESLLQLRGVSDVLRGANVYVIVNTTLDPAARTTSINRFAVMIRSFETMMHFSYRHAVHAATAFCRSAHLNLRVASAPPIAGDTGVLRFDTEAMRQAFQAASDLARSGQAWSGGLH
jgi:predicted acylesterase/phospholipase RssA